MVTLQEIQQALQDEDRIVYAIVASSWSSLYPNNATTPKGVIVRVGDVRRSHSECGYEVKIAVSPYETWADPVSVELGWNLCDGCKSRMSQCCCDELAAEREDEYGSWCDACGCDGESNYGQCLYWSIYNSGNCPELTGTF